MMFAVLNRGPKRGRHAHLVALPLYLAAGCGDPADPIEESGDATTAATTATAATGGPGTSSTGGDASTATPTATTEPTTGSTGGATSDETTSDASSTGPATCVKNVVLMGYWPPTNEMLRPWSTDPTQNPGRWIGEDWGGHGYNVHAFFPEFPPDGDPVNDQIGDDGAVGSPDYDLRVDYQATSADFWRLVDNYQPVILLTTSRGGKIGWEIEALEGGHGMNNPGDPAMDWVSDAYGVDHFPTEATIEPRSWAAISTYRQGSTLPSQLPIDAIVEVTSALALTDVVVNQETSGNFLSGFLALHGLVYNQQSPHNVAAGHIHVGYGLPVADASALIEATLDAVLLQHPADSVDCP